MYQNIMVGLDGSTHGLAAARHGAELAARFDAKLHLLTVTRPYRVSPELQRYLNAERLLGEPKYVLDEMTHGIIAEAKKIAAQLGVEKIESVVKEGKPARTLVDYAKAKGVDLIVVGSRGVGELEAALLGSVSHKVSMLAHCAVMIIKE